MRFDHLFSSFDSKIQGKVDELIFNSRCDDDGDGGGGDGGGG